MTPPSIPPAKGPVEKKVAWASVGTYLGLVVLLAVVNAVNADATLISGLPDWLETLLLPLVPAMVSFLGGYTAKHTPRPDLEATPPPGGGTGGTATGTPRGGVYPNDIPPGRDPFGK